MEPPASFFFRNMGTIKIFDLFSSLRSDVSHGEHGRKAGELRCAEIRRAAQFAAALGSSPVQLPLASTVPLGGHPPQRKGALRVQVSARASLQASFRGHRRGSRVFFFSVRCVPPGTAGKSSLARRTSPDTCERTQASSPTGGISTSALTLAAVTVNVLRSPHLRALPFSSQV